MKTRLIFGWVLAATAITTMTWNRIVDGNDCMKPKQSNPLSTPCDECYLVISAGKYVKCDVGAGNPIETTCDESTTQNGVVCEETEQDCGGPALMFDTAQDCANNQNGRFELQTCVDFGITWTEASWEDQGDDPICDGGGVE